MPRPSTRTPPRRTSPCSTAPPHAAFRAGDAVRRAAERRGRPGGSRPPRAQIGSGCRKTLIPLPGSCVSARCFRPHEQQRRSAGIRRRQAQADMVTPGRTSDVGTDGVWSSHAGPSESLNGFQPVIAVPARRTNSSPHGCGRRRRRRAPWPTTAGPRSTVVEEVAERDRAAGHELARAVDDLDARIRPPRRGSGSAPRRQTITSDAPCPSPPARHGSGRRTVGAVAARVDERGHVGPVHAVGAGPQAVSERVAPKGVPVTVAPLKRRSSPRRRSSPSRRTPSRPWAARRRGMSAPS